MTESLERDYVLVSLTHKLDHKSQLLRLVPAQSLVLLGNEHLFRGELILAGLAS